MASALTSADDEALIEEILARLTLREKLGQMMQPDWRTFRSAPKLSEERPGFEGHFRAVFTKRLKLLMNDLRLFLVPVRWVLAILRDFEVEGAARLLEKLGPHGGGARGVDRL